MLSEDKRKVLHILFLVWAFTLRFMGKYPSAILVFMAVLFNLWLLPRLFPEIIRPWEKSSHLLRGIMSYPVTILILVLVVPWQYKDVVAGAWAILAIGDASSDLVSRWVGWHYWSWNRSKTIEGTFFFGLLGFLAAMGMMLWTTPTLTWNGIWPGVLLASLVAGFLESLPLPWDDNITIGVSSALILLLFRGYILM